MSMQPLAITCLNTAFCFSGPCTYKHGSCREAGTATSHTVCCDILGSTDRTDSMLVHRSQYLFVEPVIDPNPGGGAYGGLLFAVVSLTKFPHPFNTVPHIGIPALVAIILQATRGGHVFLILAIPEVRSTHPLFPISFISGTLDNDLTTCGKSYGTKTETIHRPVFRQILGL